MLFFIIRLVCLVQQQQQLALVCLELKAQALAKPRLVQVDYLGKLGLDWVNNRYIGILYLVQHNKHYHTKVLFNSFYLNGHTLGVSFTDLNFRITMYSTA